MLYIGSAVLSYARTQRVLRVYLTTNAQLLNCDWASTRTTQVIETPRENFTSNMNPNSQHTRKTYVPTHIHTLYTTTSYKNHRYHSTHPTDQEHLPSNLPTTTLHPPHMHTHIHHTHTCAHAHTHTHIHTHTHTHTCTHTHPPTHTPREQCPSRPRHLAYRCSYSPSSSACLPYPPIVVPDRDCEPPGVDCFPTSQKTVCVSRVCLCVTYWLVTFNYDVTL